MEKHFVIDQNVSVQVADRSLLLKRLPTAVALRHLPEIPSVD